MGSINQVYAKEDERWLNEHFTLWRYVPLRTLLFYLTGNIFIPAIETLRREDPFEGKFFFDTSWFNSVMRQRYGEKGEELEDWIYRELCSESERKQIEVNKAFPNYAAGIFEQHYFDFLRKTRYAWCWFLSDSESAAMWNNYGKQGVAIAGKVGKLCELLGKTGHDFEVGQMRYIRLIAGDVRDYDFNPEEAEDARFLLKPHFLKRKEYESEKEVRFVTAAPERGRNAGIMLEQISPDKWIHEIRLWPGLKAVEEQSIKQVVAKFAPNVPCECSDLFGAGSFSNESFVAAVLAGLDASNWDRWKQGTDDIPPELKEL
jgi:hypothetical protein